MPRRVDRQERRQAIAEAIVRLVSERGLEAASLRAVAAEAGVSMGAVQHYFTSHDEMLLFALEYGNAVLGERIQAMLAERGPVAPREALRLLIGMLVPADDESRSGARLWAALIARACVDEPTRRLAADAYAGLTAAAVRWITESLPAGQEAGSKHAARDARHLVAVIEGLRWPLLFGAWTQDEAMAVLDAELDQVLGARQPG